MSTLLDCGNTTVFTPALWAARLFSLMPLTGSILPLKVISPLRATFLLAGRDVRREMRARAMVTPAEGPSLGIAPAGM